MNDTVNIAIDRQEKEKLDTLKVHPRETYGEVVHRIIENEMRRQKR
jgi:hypothetical protein